MPLPKMLFTLFRAREQKRGESKKRGEQIFGFGGRKRQPTWQKNEGKRVLYPRVGLPDLEKSPRDQGQK